MIRNKALEDERIKLSAIVNVFNKQNEILQEMFLALENLRKEQEQYLFSENFNPCLVSNYTSFSNKINQEILTQKQIIERTKLDLLKQQAITKDAYIKVKSLEKLKEKQKFEETKIYLHFM